MSHERAMGLAAIYAGECNPRAELARALIESDARGRRLEEALRTASVALDDWLNDYAHDLCDADRVREARDRIAEHGTIGYIAHVQADVRAALEPTP